MSKKLQELYEKEFDEKAKSTLYYGFSYNNEYVEWLEQRLEAGQHDTKKWKYFGDCCPRCGDGAEVYTDSDEEGYFFEDDDARCVGCGLTGGVIISESHGAGISWA